MRFPLSLSLCLCLVAEVQSFWYETIAKQGVAPFNPQGSAYQVYRNVKDFGAQGDGVTDDTDAINLAISTGTRCVPGGPGCQSSTTSPAVVYFPAGTYLISQPIVLYYMTNMIGDPQNMPVIKGNAIFDPSGIALLDANPYLSANPAYITTNVFYRQVRNFIFDTTAMDPHSVQRAIHWPTAQATSLQNCVFKLSDAVGSQHVGVFIENGSGGFLNDLVFYGGNHAMEVGSQQFTSRNLTFYNSATAIYQAWNWGWTYTSLSMNNCSIGLDLTPVNSTTNQQEVGSVVIIDSTFTNTPLAIWSSRSSTAPAPNSGGGITLENVVFTNVPRIIQGPSAITLAGPTTGTQTIAGWVMGNVYSPNGVSTGAIGPVSAFVRPAGLTTGTAGEYYTRSKPQYQTVAASGFSSVRTAGAKGDGVTDDTTVIQNLLNSATAAGQIIYFDSGIYKITTSITIPPGARIVGEAYPVIMASGSFFNNALNPVPVVGVGLATGQTGIVEWSDMVVSTQGACAGAILIQWNLASPAATPSGMWDIHTRIGGFEGSNLQVAQCPTTAAQPNAACQAAFQSMRISSIGTGLYMENNWFWTADHDLDDAANANTRISVYTGRGLSIEGVTGNYWLVGTAVEHHALYQYQLVNTKSVFMGFIQTETPYYQPSPVASTSFSTFTDRFDPDFAQFCAGKAATCNMAWGLRVLNSTDVFVYGAGLYSFFNNFNSTCSAHDVLAGVYNEVCQAQIFGIDEGQPAGTVYSGSQVYVWGLSTVGSVSMVDRSGASVAAQSANTGVFASTIQRYVTEVPGT